MSAEGETKLPAPFDRVRLVCSFDSAEQIRLWYSGPCDQLIESGAIEPQMAQVRGRGRNPRLDSHGDYFSRYKGKGDWLKVFRRITDIDRASNLPGVRAIFPAGLRPEVELPYLTRDRCVGRYQRRVTWRCEDNLIVPDWNRLKIDRLEAAQSH